MSYQVSLGSTGVISFANNTTLASSGVVYGGFSCDGATLNAVTAATSFQIVSLFALGDSSLATLKAALTYKANYGNFVMVDSAGLDFAANTQTGINFGSFTAGIFYDCLFIVDSVALGGLSWFLGVYDQGHINDGAHQVSTWYRNTGSPTITTSAGTGCVFLGNSSVGTLGTAQIYDWMATGVDSSLGTYTAPLEEGAGSSVSPGGTISGSFSWQGSAPTLMRFVRRQTFPRRSRR